MAMPAIRPGPATTPLVVTYVAYAVIAVPLVVWLSRTLTANGATFLHDVFPERRDLADAINHLLAVGFLLLNLGDALLLLTANDGVGTTLEAVELLVSKLGTLLLSLGAIHFVNMFVFWRIRQRTRDDERLPVAPTVVRPPTPPTGVTPAPSGG